MPIFYQILKIYTFSAAYLQTSYILILAEGTFIFKVQKTSLQECCLYYQLQFGKSRA
jgi:hypothetical protein